MSRLLRASEAQKAARDRVCHAEWGERLTLDQFLARERRLRAHPWARAQMTTWLWVDGNDQVLASCETFRMESWLAPEATPQGAYAVASVVTEPALRGRGHAGAMMRALVETLRTEDPRAHASILFSDVGPTLYERAGYVGVAAPEEWVFDPLPESPRPDVDEWLGETELARALTRMERPRTPYLVWPTASQLDWHLERERFYAETLHEPRPETWGARVGEAWVLWAGDLKNRRLVIQLLVAQSGREAAPLLLAARHTAFRAGLREVAMWRETVPFSEASAPPAARLVPRAGSLCMLVPLDPRVHVHSWRIIPRALWV